VPNPTDRDGKSKTASAVDQEHYPEQNEVDNHGTISEFDHAEIAERANQLWRSRGCPPGTVHQDWFEARERLRAKKNSQATKKQGDDSGSVQP
jgi:hypothetical protein